MSLSKLQGLMMDREAWHAAVHGGHRNLDKTEWLKWTERVCLFKQKIPCKPHKNTKIYEWIRQNSRIKKAQFPHLHSGHPWRFIPSSELPYVISSLSDDCITAQHLPLLNSTSFSPVLSSVQSLSHVRLCNPMDCSTPGFLVHHQILEFTQTHDHWIGDVIQPSHPLSSPSPTAFNLSQHQGLFKWVSSSHQVAKVLEFQLQHQSF